MQDPEDQEERTERAGRERAQPALPLRALGEGGSQALEGSQLEDSLEARIVGALELEPQPLTRLEIMPSIDLDEGPHHPRGGPQQRSLPQETLSSAAERQDPNLDIDEAFARVAEGEGALSARRLHDRPRSSSSPVRAEVSSGSLPGEDLLGLAHARSLSRRPGIARGPQGES